MRVRVCEVGGEGGGEGERQRDVMQMKGPKQPRETRANIAFKIQVQVGFEIQVEPVTSAQPTPR